MEERRERREWEGGILIVKALLGAQQYHHIFFSRFSPRERAGARKRIEKTPRERIENKSRWKAQRKMTAASKHQTLCSSFLFYLLFFVIQLVFFFSIIRFGNFHIVRIIVYLLISPPPPPSLTPYPTPTPTHPTKSHHQTTIHPLVHHPPPPPP